MERFAAIRLNIMGTMSNLKKEWSFVRQIWRDAKASDYEKNYLVPIVKRQNNISNRIEDLERIAKKLKNMGVDI